MAFLRAYMAQSRGTLPGRGQRAGDPFFGSLIGIGAGLLRKGIQKIKASPIAKAHARRAVTGPFAPFMPPSMVGPGALGFGKKPMRMLPAGAGGGFGGVRRRYRRINAGNTKALNRAFRRVKAFGKLASKAGYVKRQSGRSFSRARKR